MTEFSHSISDQIIALEKENEQNARDSKFYRRLLIQLAMMNGGTLSIDPQFGEQAINYKDGFEINSKGFHLLSKI